MCEKNVPKQSACVKTQHNKSRALTNWFMYVFMRVYVYVCIHMNFCVYGHYFSEHEYAHTCVHLRKCK